MDDGTSSAKAEQDPALSLQAERIAFVFEVIGTLALAAEDAGPDGHMEYAIQVLGAHGRTLATAMANALILFDDKRRAFARGTVRPRTCQATSETDPLAT